MPAALKVGLFALSLHAAHATMELTPDNFDEVVFKSGKSALYAVHHRAHPAHSPASCQHATGPGDGASERACTRARAQQPPHAAFLAVSAGGGHTIGGWRWPSLTAPSRRCSHALRLCLPSLACAASSSSRLGEAIASP